MPHNGCIIHYFKELKKKKQKNKTTPEKKIYTQSVCIGQAKETRESETTLGQKFQSVREWGQIDHKAK